MERIRAYAIAQKCVQLLKQRFQVEKVYIFGSVTGDGSWHARSDIDIAVEGLPPADYMRALNAVWELLPDGLELDLVSLEEVSTEFQMSIRRADSMLDGREQDKSASPIEGQLTFHDESKMALSRVDRLQAQIDIELGNLGRIAQDLGDFLKQISGRQPSTIELSGIGGHLHGFYMGVERIFERIAVTVDGGLPAGESWHTDLLRQMEIEYTGTRPAAIDHPLALQLLDYLRFRHLFRNTYGYELIWDKCRPLAENLPNTLEALQGHLSRLFDTLQENQQNRTSANGQLGSC